MCWSCGAKLPWANAITIQAARQALEASKGAAPSRVGLLVPLLWVLILVSTGFFVYRGTGASQSVMASLKRVTQSINLADVQSAGGAAQTLPQLTPKPVTASAARGLGAVRATNTQSKAGTPKVAGAEGIPAVRRPLPSSNDTKRVITKAEYDQITMNMSLSECVSIIGATGTLAAGRQVVLQGRATASYMWQNADGSNMMAEFESGRLVAKAQAGL
jgi:hypothetical protein